MLSIITTDEHFRVDVDFDRWESENEIRGTGRQVYRWACWELMPHLSLTESGLKMEAWQLIASGDDIRSGTLYIDSEDYADKACLRRAMHTFISFFGAFAEASPGGENYDLFNEALRYYAEAYASDLSDYVVEHLGPEA